MHACYFQLSSASLPLFSYASLFGMLPVSGNEKTYCAVQLLAMKKANFSTDKIDKNEDALDYRYCNLKFL